MIFCSNLVPWRLQLPETVYDLSGPVPQLFIMDTIAEMKIFMDRLIYVFDDPNIYYKFVENKDASGHSIVELVLSTKVIYLPNLMR